MSRKFLLATLLALSLPAHAQLLDRVTGTVNGVLPDQIGPVDLNPTPSQQMPSPMVQPQVANPVAPVYNTRQNTLVLPPVQQRSAPVYAVPPQPGAPAPLTQPGGGYQPSYGAMPAPKPLSSFQQYLLETTGKVVPNYADDLFFTDAFTPNGAAPVPSNYTVGPGDEILIRVWGGVNANYAGVVDREGQFNVPRVGTFPVAGIPLSELNSYLTQQIGRYYKNFNVSATLGSLRGIQVYVVGQAAQPGLYSVSSLSTLVTAVFSVAMPGPNGSYRKISLKRGGEIIAELDIYDFIANGNTAGDKKLLAGDVIVIERTGPRVAILGAVEKPAIYELLPGEPLGTALDLAGVQSAMTSRSQIAIERFGQAGQDQRVSIPTTYEDAMADTGATDGQVVRLVDPSAELTNAVTLRGNVATPGRVPFRPGMRVSDLIPNEQSLITNDYYRQRDKLLSPSGGGNVSLSGVDASLNMLSEINWDYAVVERLDKAEVRTRLLPFNLRDAIAKVEGQDLELKAGDVITVFSVNDAQVPKDNRSLTVKIEGEVAAPGFYQLKPGDTLQDLMVKAGGPTRNAFLYGLRLNRLSLRSQQQAQLNKAIEQAERMLAGAQRNNAVQVDGQNQSLVALQAQSQAAFLDKAKQIQAEGRLVLNIPVDAQTAFDLPLVELENGDVVKVPILPSTVSVAGSVFNQGSFLFEPGQKVGDYLDQSGGPTKLSDESSIFLVRANGEVISEQQYRWYLPFSVRGNKALPGDVVYVPEDFEYRLSFLQTVAQVSQVFYQLGLGVAAVDSIRN